jgi:hypothetical protein
MWRATTKLWRGLSKFTIWRVVGGRDIGATVPLQIGNELFGEARGLALMHVHIRQVFVIAIFAACILFTLLYCIVNRL